MKQDHLADNIHNGYIYIYGNKEYHVCISPIRHHCPHNTKINLDPFGYKTCQYTPGLREHKTRDIKFCLVVDDFGIKYTNDNNLQHILSYLHFFYNIGGYERRSLLRNYFKMGLQQTNIPTKHA